LCGIFGDYRFSTITETSRGLALDPCFGQNMAVSQPVIRTKATTHHHLEPLALKGHTL